MAAPKDEGVGHGFGYALLVCRIGDRGGIAAVNGERGNLERDGGTGEVVERAKGHAAEDERDVGAAESGAELVGEPEALRNPWALGAVPEEGAGLGVRRHEGGGIKVNTAAAGGGVDDDAGDRSGVVGYPGAVVEGEGGGWVWLVVLAAGEDAEAVLRQQRAQTDGEGERDILFENLTVEMSAGVLAAVGGIEKDQRAVEGCGERWRLRGRRGWGLRERRLNTREGNGAAEEGAGATSCGGMVDDSQKC